jgi:hypothetical protein
MRRHYFPFFLIEKLPLVTRAVHPLKKNRGTLLLANAVRIGWRLLCSACGTNKIRDALKQLFQLAQFSQRRFDVWPFARRAWLNAPVLVYSVVSLS